MGYHKAVSFVRLTIESYFFVNNLIFRTLTGVPRDPRVRGAEWKSAPMPPHPWEREEEERRGTVDL